MSSLQCCEVDVARFDVIGRGEERYRDAWRDEEMFGKMERYLEEWRR